MGPEPPIFAGPTPQALIGKTLILIRNDSARIQQLLNAPGAVKNILGSQLFKLGMFKRNCLRHVAFLVPESHSAKVGLGSAYLAECCAINRLVHIAVAIDQDHVDIVSRVSKLE
jgi:hypothetical protein